MLTAGFLCLIVSMTVHALATNIWLFYLGGCLLGLGLGTTTATMVTVLFQLSAAAAGRDRRALEQSKAPAV